MDAQWKSTALTLDKYLHYDDWKKSPPNAYYDSQLVRRVLRALRDLRTQGDVEGVRAVLDVAVRSNFAGVENFHLYSETFYGTKELIEEFVQEGKPQLSSSAARSCSRRALAQSRRVSSMFRACRRQSCQTKRRHASSATAARTLARPRSASVAARASATVRQSLRLDSASRADVRCRPLWSRPSNARHQYATQSDNRHLGWRTRCGYLHFRTPAAQLT